MTHVTSAAHHPTIPSRGMSGLYTLYHSEGLGSTFALAIVSSKLPIHYCYNTDASQLRILDVPHKVIILDYKCVTERKDTPEITKLKEVNPLMQFPTLVTPEGGILTETAAIALCETSL